MVLVSRFESAAQFGFELQWILNHFSCEFLGYGDRRRTRTDLPETRHLFGFYTMNNEYSDYLPGFMPPVCKGTQLQSTNTVFTIYTQKISDSKLDNFRRKVLLYIEA